MTASLECPRCHCRAETRGSGWRARSCPDCGAPMVLGRGPTEAFVRRYLYGDRPAPKQPGRRPSA